MSVSTSIAYKPGFYEKKVLNILRRMPHGKLTVSFPDNRIEVFGNGKGIDAQLDIYTQDFFQKVVLYGDIGFGEAYLVGCWDSPNVKAVIQWFIQNIEFTPGMSGSRVQNLGLNLLKFWNRVLHWGKANSKNGAIKNIAAHYDLSNEFFDLFLDQGMTYSSALFLGPEDSLEKAQENKYERLARALKLRPGMQVLEIGSGWGGNALHLAGKYDVNVTTLTISKKQKEWADQRIEDAGLQHKIKVLLKDYREISGQYDRIISIEMLEAVGDAYMETYFKKCHELLKKDGILALQVITCPDSRYSQFRDGVDFIQKHIFPGSLLPSLARINSAINATGDLNLQDLYEFGGDYAKTLAIWRANLQKKAMVAIDMGFSSQLLRKWEYYFSYCEAAFAMKNIYVMQLIYRRPNNL